MNARHTPGPWKVIETHYLPHDGDHVADMSNGLMVVPSMYGLGDPLADALLIAAAPELLEALQSAELAMSNQHFAAEVLAHDSVVREMIRAAIAKATGASA